LHHPVPLKVNGKLVMIQVLSDDGLCTRLSQALLLPVTVESPMVMWKLGVLILILALKVVTPKLKMM
jgi:hypothetical protein